MRPWLQARPASFQPIRLSRLGKGVGSWEPDSRVRVSPEFSQHVEFLQTQKRRMRRVRRRGLRPFLDRLQFGRHFQVLRFGIRLRFQPLSLGFRMGRKTQRVGPRLRFDPLGDENGDNLLRSTPGAMSAVFA